MKEKTLEGMRIKYDVRLSSEASNPRIDHKLGKFTVVIPEESDHDPEELLERRNSWILKKRKEYLRFKRKIPDRSFEEGSILTVLGEDKEIIVEKRKDNKISSNITLADHLVERSCVKDQVENLLKKDARRIIESKISEYEDKVDGNYNKIYIRDQETRWGSCTDKQNLNFNWRLILGPEHVLDYVIVHELVHLDHKNHDERFWKKVREICPEFRKSNQWLAERSSELVFDPSKIEDK